MVRDSVLSSSSLKGVGSRCVRSPLMIADTVCRMLSTRDISARRVITPTMSPAITSTARAAANPYQNRRSRGANSLLSRPMSR